jgi:hypothetical protein
MIPNQHDTTDESSRKPEKRPAVEGLDMDNLENFRPIPVCVN